MLVERVSMAELRRTRRELETKLLSEYSAQRLEYDFLLSRVQILLILSIAFGIISVFSLITNYSPHIVGLLLTAAASIVGILFTVQIQQIILRETRSIRYSLNELAHEIARIEDVDLQYYRQMVDVRGQAFLQIELCWGLYCFHSFFIVTALLKFVGLWNVTM
jgi:hypothetical protein